MYSHHQYVVATLLLVCVPAVEPGAMKTHMHTLFDNILGSSYNKKIRPVTDSDPVLPVQVGFKLRSIVDVDAEAQILSVYATLEMTWNDSYLTWDPSSYGNLTQIQTIQDDIWLPDIVVANSASVREQLGYDNMPITISSAGTVKWSPTVLIQSSCHIDVEYFPFDTQVCRIEFTTDVSGFTEVTVAILPIFAIDMVDYTCDGQWFFIDYAANNLDNGPYKSRVMFSFELKRRRTFYFNNIMIPVFILTLTSPLMFLVPADAGEKLGGSLTMLLTIVFYLTLVIDYLPNSSLTKSIFAFYVLSVLVCNAFMVTSIVFTLRLRHRQTPVPKGYVRFTHKMESLIRFITCNKRNVESHSGTRTSTTFNADVVTYTPAPDAEPTQGTGNSQENHVEWSDVANALDRFFFLCFSLLIILYTFISFIIMYVGGWSTKHNIKC